MKKETKEKLKIFGVIFLITLVFCLPFLFPHKITDTYWNIGEGISLYKFTPLKDGRIINFLILSALELLNVKMETYTIFVHYLCVIIYALVIDNVYTCINQILKSKIEKSKYPKILKTVFLLASILIVFNPLTVENFAYIDNLTMSLSLLLGAIAAKTLYENKQYAYIKTTLLMFLAGLCYQGNLNMWIALSVLYFAIGEKKTIKEWVKYFAKIASIVIIVLASMLAIINIANYAIGSNQSRLGNAGIDFKDFTSLFELFFIKPLTAITFGYYPKYLIIISIIITALYIIGAGKKDLFKTLAKYILIICIILLACIIPAFFQKEVTISARTINGIGAIIGISIVYMYYVILKKENENKIRVGILLIISIIMIGLNLYDYYNTAYMNHVTTIEEEKYVNQINDVMLEYEQKNDIILKKVMFFKDEHYPRTYNNLIYNTFNTRGIIANYARLYCLNYYTGRNLEEIPQEEEVYNKYFKGKDWNSFDKEQVQFDGDTVYICAY